MQAPPLSDAAQPNAAASAASATPRTGSQDFAAAFRDAGVKPARKGAANKQQDPASSGSALPAPGHQPPPAVQPAPPPAKTDVSAAAVAAAAADSKDATGSAQGSVPSAIAAASSAQANASGMTTILSAATLDPAPPVAAALPAAAGLPGIAPPSASAVGEDAAPPSAGSSAPHAASVRTLATPGTSTAATVPALPSSNLGNVKLRDSSADPGTNASANAAPPASNALSDSTSSNGPVATGADAAAQALMAAAIAQGTNAPASDTDSGVPQGTAVPSDAAAGAAGAADAAAPALALAQASAQASAAAMSAVMSAATAAASIAQAVSVAASPSAADKRSHGNNPDSTLAGAANDGSVGAAQLLTSNTATDGVPTPTFKVAAGVDTAQFGQGVADRVALMMDGNLTSAKLQVNPPALGPIEVRIALQGGHAQVSFLSHSAVTRDALESSSSKLREMLGSQGFSQVSVDISQRSFQERSPHSQAYETAPSIGDDVPVMAPASVSMARNASGLLDAYA
jgi:flagellar hook-length control protein FliK